MAKLSISQNPTFDAIIKIPLPGTDKEAQPVRFTFKVLGRAAMKEFLDRLQQPGDNETASLMEVVAGWEFDDEFNKTSMEKLLDTFIGIGGIIIRTFIDEQTKARLGN